MKRIAMTRWIRCLTVLTLGLVMQLRAESVATLPSAAQDVMDRYFAALQSGDATSLSRLLGGSLKARTMSNMATPEGDAAVAADNAERTFVLENWETHGGGFLIVVWSSTDGQETIRRRSWLAQAVRGPSQGFQIVEEEIVP